MTDFFTKARLFYGNLEPARQTQLWLAVAGVVIAVIGVSWWMTTEPYAVVMAGTQAELSEAAALLREEGIPVETDGTSVSVPEARRGEAMGVIAPLYQGPSLKDTEGMGMGTSPKMGAWGRDRQLQGELARSIADLPGIHAAMVTITRGDPPLFVGEDPTPSRASVYLKVSPNQPPNATTARSISNMVANAVKGLEPSYVAVVDSLGMTHLDGQGGGSGDARMAGEIMVMREKYAAEARANIMQQLRGVAGMDNAFLVSVAAEVEHQSRSVRKKDYDGDRAFKTSSKLDEKAKEKSQPNQEGIPGVDGELPERAEANGGGAMNKEDSTRIEEQFKAPETFETVIVPAGALKSLSVAVTVNQAALSEVWGLEPGTPEFAAELAKVEGLVKNAMGFNETRGDSMTLQALPFADIPVEEAPMVNVGGVLGMVAPFVPYAIALVALLLAFVFVVRPLVAQVSKAPLPKRVPQEDLVVGPDGKPRRLAPGEELDEDDLAERLHRLVENFQPVDSADLNRLVEQQSDASAKVVRDWMKQGA